MRQTEKIALVNGRIHTPAGMVSEVAMEFGCIAPDPGGATKVIDLQGRTVLPGFCDASARFFEWAAAQDGIPAEGRQSMSDGELARLLSVYGPRAAALGLTEISSDDLGAFGQDFRRMLGFFMNAAYNIPFRLHFQPCPPSALMDFLSDGWRSGEGTPFCQVGALRIPDTLGRQDLEDLVAAAHSAGMQIALEGPFEGALSALERQRDANLRHLLMTPPADDLQIDRMRRARIGGIMRQGQDWRMAIRRGGIVVCAGSGYPLESPLAGIQAAVNMGLTVAEAIGAYTWNAAWNGRNERRRGEIAVGRDADLVVLERDPFTTPYHKLADIGVVMTVCAGCVTYDAGLLAGQ